MSSYLVVLALLAAEPHVVDPRVHLSIEPEGDDPTRVVVRYVPVAERVAALREGPLDETTGQRYLTLALIDQKNSAKIGPPLFGQYDFHDGRLEFRPRFGLVRGLSYRAHGYRVVAEKQFFAAATGYFVPQHGDAPATRVGSISPHADLLPANVLRFYVTFSRPMREGREVLERIKLYHVNGEEIPAPWRDVELWDDDATRLALYIHPGRIKQGVNLREELGPVLRPGEEYVLEVTDELLDFRGRKIKPFKLEFRAGVEVRSRIDLTKWSIHRPRAGTTEKLIVEFDRPLDSASAMRFVQLVDERGEPISGSFHVFTRYAVVEPAAAWKAGRLRLRVDPRLEDVCGNTPVRVFDHDLEAPTVDVLPPVLERLIEIREQE